MMLGALLVAAVLGTTWAQTRVDIDECDNGSDMATKNFYPIPGKCTQYYRCVGDVPRSAYIMNCGPGTHFNADTQTCDMPNSANCMQCVAGVTMMDDTCCGGYYACENGNIKAMFCPDNMPFNDATGQCYTVGSAVGNCDGKPRCAYRTDSAPAEVETTCAEKGWRPNEADTNSCSYQVNIGNNNYVVQACPAGMRFSYTSPNQDCGCVVDKSGPCRVIYPDTSSQKTCSSPAAQIRLDTSSLGVPAYKNGDERIWVEKTKTTGGTNGAFFSGSSSLRIPYLANNAMLFSADFGLQITFTVDGNAPINQDMVLFTNDFGMQRAARECDATVTLKVRRVSNNQMEVTFMVVDSAGQTRSISTTFNTDSTRSWYRVTVAATNTAADRGRLLGKVERASAANMQSPIVESMQQGQFTPAIPYVQCNPGFGDNNAGQGFQGTMTDVMIYYGCAGISTLI